MKPLDLPAGQSGATLQILSSRGKAIVRKTASAAAGNDRLRRQMAKQKAFGEAVQPVRVPEILASETDANGLFFFDMEFIPGLDGHRFLEKCDPEGMRQFAHKLSTHLAQIPTLPMIGKETAFRNLHDSCIYKLIEVHGRDAGLSDALAGKMLRALDAVKDCNIGAQGFCHGDFTLENIMVDSSGELYLVDFLDSNFEHPIQDFIKLGQDVHGGWFRIKGRRISSSFISYLNDMITASGRHTIAGYDEIRPALLALNFCRILPYVQEENLKKLVIARIEQSIRTIL